MNCKKIIATIFTISATICLNAQCKSIDIDCAKQIQTATKFLYGACLEDLNHEVYGGLYGQMIFGERFEEPPEGAIPSDFEAAHGSWRTLPTHTEGDPSSEIAVLLHKERGEEGEISLEMSPKPHKPILLLNGTYPDKNNLGAMDTYYVDIRQREIIIFGPHRKYLRKTPVKYDFDKWNTFGAKISHKNGLEVKLNGKIVAHYPDLKPLRKDGYFGIGYNTDPGEISGVRNFRLSTNGKNFYSALAGYSSREQISGRWTKSDNSKNAKYQIAHEKDRTVQIIEGLDKQSFASVVNRGTFKNGFFVKKDEEFDGFITLRSEIEKDAKVIVKFADREVDLNVDKNSNGEIKKYSFKIKSNSKHDNTDFAIILRGKGKIALDMAYLQRSKLWRNIANVRHDIADKIAEQNLGILRYGGTMVNNPNYKFKSMYGDKDKRPTFRGHWYRYASLGFGVIEFTQFCEALGAEPVFAINLEESPEDVADMIDYFNGATSTQWGAKRAADGHPEPYKLKYIELGNEECIIDPLKENYEHFVKRVKLLADVIKKKDPSIKIIHAGWWNDKIPEIMKYVLNELDGIVDFWDMHPWVNNINSGKNIEKTIQHWRDSFKKFKPDHKMRVIILEENGSICNHQRAISHAGILQTVRKNMDFVVATCPANALEAYKQNFNGWHQGIVFFDKNKAFGQPSFYVQKMDAQHLLPRVVKTSEHNKLIVSAATDNEGETLAVYIVNPTMEEIDVPINISNFNGDTSKAKATTLAGNRNDENNPNAPEHISPVEYIWNFDNDKIFKSRPYSYTILKFSSQ